MLRDRLLKPCPVISATATPTPPATAPAAPPAVPPPAPGQPAPTTPNTTPLPQASAIPGVTCRTLG